MSADAGTGRAAAGLVLLAGLSVLGAPPLAAQQAAIQAARLGGADWHLSSPLGEAAGPLVVLLGAPGSWRLDLARDDGAGIDRRQDLLRRQGDGWTLTADGGAAFLQPWHEPWRRLDPRSAAALERLLRLWSGGPPAATTPAGPRRWRTTPRPAISDLHLPDAEGLLAFRRNGGRDGPALSADPGALRRRLVARGHGRGGEDLRLLVAWNRSRLTVRTNRWPGRLVVAPAVWQDVRAPAEAFLPLWPLADVVP